MFTSSTGIPQLPVVKQPETSAQPPVVEQPINADSIKVIGDIGNRTKQSTQETRSVGNSIRNFFRGMCGSSSSTESSNKRENNGCFDSCFDPIIVVQMRYLIRFVVARDRTVQ